MNDFLKNRNNTKGLIFILLFRISNFLSKSKFFRVLGFPIRVFYRLIVQWVLGIDIPDTTYIGNGFVVYHGMGLVVNDKVKIGRNVTLRHNTTIGNAKTGGVCPIIEDNVNVGANCVIIGGITLGRNAIIGAGSVVISDIPSNSIAVGNPARVIRTI